MEHTHREAREVLALHLRRHGAPDPLELGHVLDRVEPLYIGRVNVREAEQRQAFL